MATAKVTKPNPCGYKLYKKDVNHGKLYKGFINYKPYNRENETYHIGFLVSSDTFVILTKDGKETRLGQYNVLDSYSHFEEASDCLKIEIDNSKRND